MSDDVPPEGDELFELDPEEFVTARDALARRLRSEGQKAEATAVKGLRRPTVAAWALNQLARRHRDEVEALVAEGQELAQAQGRALSGERAGFREAAQRRREAIRQLTRQADTILGSRNAPVHRDDVVATLTAASVDPEAAVRLLEGRLSAPIPAPTGFEGTGMEAPAGAATAESAPATAPPAKRGRATKGEAARQRAAEARRAAEEEQDRAEEAAAAAREAAGAADASDAEVKRLEAALDDARRAAGDDARRAREAMARAEAAAKRAEAAAERAERAERGA